MRLSVVLLALLSYASLLAWLAVSFLVAVPFVAGGIFAFPEPVAWALIGIGCFIAAFGLITLVAVLRVRLEPPTGLEIRRADSPALFAMLDQLQASLRASAVHKVVLSWDCNAGVWATPRLGLFGWSRHHLELGLPLLEILSLEELHSVLAHEFAHISGQHGRITGWIYRLRRYWVKAFEQAQRRVTTHRVSLRALFLKFFSWIWPRFSAYSFVLSRANEFKADAIAARFGGRENAASALLSLKLYSRLIYERFWPDLWRHTADEPEPPADVFDRLRAALHAGVPAEQAGLWLREAYRVFTSHEDTHPCLTERVQALGSVRFTKDKVERFPAPVQTSAAAALFGANLPRLQADLTRLWQKEATENWHLNRAKSRLFREQVETLERVAPLSESNPEVLWDKARALAELQGDADAEPLLRQVLALRPTHALANFHLGRSLLAVGNPAGEEFLERAMTANESLVPAAGGILTEHFTRNGQPARVRDVRARLDRHDARMAASQAERNSVNANDTFIAHELALEALVQLEAVLRKETEVAAAFLVRKELKHFPEQRLFVLVIRLTRRWYVPPNPSKSAAVVSRLVREVRLPGRVLVIGEQGGFAAVAKKAKKVAGARCYEAKGESK